jgi:hypothetical protein
MWSPQQRLLDGLDLLREELAGKSDAEQRERKDTGEHAETQDCDEYDGADHLLDVRSIHSFATINRQRLIKCETNEFALNAIVLDPV